MTDPTPQTTPTRDEAVRAADLIRSRIGQEFDGEALFSELEANIFIRLLLASTPAPASGRVDAVAWRTVSDFVDEMLRDWPGGDDCRMGFGLNGATVTKGQFRAVQAALASLSPAATPVSEAEPVAWPAQSGGLNADWVAMVLAEDARIEDGKLANGPYLAVKIAEAADLPSEVSRLRGALANIRDHTRETSTATMALGALAQPASSPAGGDVREAAARICEEARPVRGHVIEFDGMQFVKIDDVNSELNKRAAEIRALSQSTSAGRVGDGA